MWLHIHVKRKQEDLYDLGYQAYMPKLTDCLV